MTYKIVELFNSIEGEGIRAGKTATFIRLAGCNLRCTYCDTTYAFDVNAPTITEMTADEILEKVETAGYERVTLTGGEPLCTPGVEALIYQLLSNEIEVNIETNGSVDTAPLLNYLTVQKGLFVSDDLIFTMDYKLPSSGQTQHMHIPNYDMLDSCDVLKFVVGSEEDVSAMLAFLQTLKSRPNIYIGAVYGQYDLQKLVQHQLTQPLLIDATLQLQLHKIIWDPSATGV